MASRAQKGFDEGLGKLFELRTDYLRHLIRKRRPGKPPSFNGEVLRPKIRYLQELAEESVANNRVLKSEFEVLVKTSARWHPRMGGRRGAEAKKAGFGEFWNEKIGSKNFVYVFWEGALCRYVGRTGASHVRPQAHFGRPWFYKVTRIDIYVAIPSCVPKLECLAVHRFQPTENQIRPSNRKWAKKCPVCKAGKDVRLELKRIFRIR